MSETPEIDKGGGHGHVALIAALGARTRVIGARGGLVWQIPGDLARFKALTSGHPVVMGRKTWESLPPQARPLPGRRNIVVTRQAGYAAPGAELADSLEEALALAAQDGEVFVMGGGEIYAAALPHADRLYLTLVEDEAPGDTTFPPYESVFTRVLSREEHVSPRGLHYAWVELARG